ncbi:MAG TPA: OB-fold domain-containing protein [Dehalococcoidia bacterium]|nr:OB-fold domain-containing protein [Dehalococcoidia bacterium]
MPYFPPGMPLPQPTQDDAGWWEACRRHELTIQRCAGCGAFRHTPRPVCFACRSFEFIWQPVSGRGRIFSYTVAHHPPHPVLRDRVPYTVIVVELPDADNVRLISNLVDDRDAPVEIGQEVEVVWDDLAENISLPLFRRLP